MNARSIFPMFLIFLAALPLTPQDNSAVRLYKDIAIAENSPGAYADFSVPQGKWRIASIMALASLGTGVVTNDVETTITSNPAFVLGASETDAVDPLLLVGAPGGGAFRATATKKKPMGAVWVRVIVTLRRA
jgi:hypothetical protein